MKNTVDGFSAALWFLKKAYMIDGGKGSGNFNHAGRPGKVGGSASGEGSSGYSVYADADSEDDWIHANHKKGGEAWTQLQKIFDEGGPEAVTKEYYKFKTDKSTKDLDLIDDRKADEVLCLLL